MTTTPQAALLSEAAKNALVTLDGIADTNPRDTADFETPAEWITWAKSRARWAADALRTPVSQEIYAERILKQMLHEAGQDSPDKECNTCGFIGQEDPVKGCPKCGFDAMLDKLQATQEPVQAGELPDERGAFEKWASDNGEFPRAVARSGDVYHLMATQTYWLAWKARAALSARKPLPYDLICNAIDLADTESMKGDYMLDSGDCIAVVRTMQALIEINGIGLEVKP